MNRQAAFLANLETIKRIIGVICRRNLVPAADQEDFESVVMTRLIENDYAVFAKFEGRSSLTTYLNVVIVRYFHDFRSARWGRWRISAEARRLGAVAMRLETLISRDRNTLRQAIQIMRSQTPDLPGDKELYLLHARLPERVRAQEVDTEEAVHQTPAPVFTDDDLTEIETARMREFVYTQLEAALATLPPDGVVILRMFYFSDMSVADIARQLGTEQKPLYRRRDKCLAQLLPELEKRGVTREMLLELLNSRR